MYMNKQISANQYRKIIIISIIIMIIFTFLYVTQYVIDTNIPNEIKLIVNKKEEFAFNVPIEAKISSEKKGVFNVNESNIIFNNFNLDLNKSFSVSSKEIGEYYAFLKLFGIIPIKSVKVNVIPDTELIPCGLTVGVIVNTKGILVLGTGVVQGIDGKNYEPSHGLLKTGDYIIKLNDEDIENKEKLIEKIKTIKNNQMILTVLRDNKEIKVPITPIKIREDEYKVGIWIRDDIQGIGTLTYIDKNNNTFGALGHGISDADINCLLKIKDGEIMKTELTTIKKGENGKPGEISGLILDDDKSILGKVNQNTTDGIFGVVNSSIYDIVEKNNLPIGLKQEIKEGAAIIRSCVDGSVKDYNINIKKIYFGDKDFNKGMIIEVVDEDLIKKTNGIVQGMSGSPIIQNNKIIGAVTHVFVQDSTKGYGTFIENMLKSQN